MLDPGLAFREIARVFKAWRSAYFHCPHDKQVPGNHVACAPALQWER